MPRLGLASVGLLCPATWCKRWSVSLYCIVLRSPPRRLGKEVLRAIDCLSGRLCRYLSLRSFWLLIPPGAKLARDRRQHFPKAGVQNNWPGGHPEYGFRPGHRMPRRQFFVPALQGQKFRDDQEFVSESGAEMVGAETMPPAIKLPASARWRKTEPRRLGAGWQRHLLVGQRLVERCDFNLYRSRPIATR